MKQNFLKLQQIWRDDDCCCQDSNDLPTNKQQSLVRSLNIGHHCTQLYHTGHGETGHSSRLRRKQTTVTVSSVISNSRSRL